MKKIIMICLLLVFVLTSGCTPVSEMKTLETENSNAKLVEGTSEAAIFAFPSASLAFYESWEEKSDRVSCKIRWTNNSDQAYSFIEMFPVFKAEQVKEINDPNALQLDRLALPDDAEKKISPQKSQTLTLQFKLKNQEDRVYLTFGTIDGFEKHYDVSLE